MSITYIVETNSPTPIPIQDLGIFVSKQKPVFISQTQLKSSILLAQLKAIGTVRVSARSLARDVRLSAPASKTPTKIDYQAPAPKGVHKPPAPSQRPARVAAPRRAVSSQDVPLPLPEPPVKSRKFRKGEPAEDRK